MPDRLQQLIGWILAVASAPLQGVLATAVWLDSPGPSLFVTERVGEGGHTFRLFKLRTMRADAHQTGPGISVAGDARVTRVGRLLRRTRMDELPQLWNVARGDMRLVGPRPEDPRYVDMSDPVHLQVFSERPGITGVAQLLHVDEARLLDPAAPEASYRDIVLPAKLALDLAYLDRRSTRLDLWVLRQTVLVVLGHAPSAAAIARRLDGAWHPPASPSAQP